MTITTTLDVPDGFAEAFHLTNAQMSEELRKAAVLHWYQQGLISKMTAANLLGISFHDLLALLSERKIDAILVDLDELRREVERARGSDRGRLAVDLSGSSPTPRNA